MQGGQCGRGACALAMVNVNAQPKNKYIGYYGQSLPPFQRKVYHP